eukprot:123919-Pelagomonas_calceolata.AAC.3
MLWMPLLSPGVLIPLGLRSRPFQVAAGPTHLHDSDRDGIFNLCCNDDLGCSVDREVKARKFAVRCGAGPAPPALGCG